MPRPDNVGVGVAVLLVDTSGRILLGKRKGSSFEGHWAPPGGWIDHTDLDAEHAARREVLEEVGVTVDALEQISWETHKNGDVTGVTLYYRAHESSGSVQLLEPDKCEEWAWFTATEIAKLQPLFPGLAATLEYFFLSESLELELNFPSDDGVAQA